MTPHSQVLYYAFYIPTKIAFKSKHSTFTLSIAYVADVWFILDVIFNFNVAYVDATGDGSSREIVIVGLLHVEFAAYSLPVSNFFSTSSS